MLVPITREATVSCISMQDPAIDPDKVKREVMRDSAGKALSDEPVAVYIRDRLRDPSSWRKTVPMKEGAKPTEFIVGVVPPAELNRIEDECRSLTEGNRSNELAWRCFLHGLRKIDGMGIEVVYHKVGGVEYVSPQWIADVFCGPLRSVAVEIGTIVWAWNNLSATDAGN